MGGDEAFKDYLSRLIKMIPAEIVGLYMIVTGFIPEDEHTWLLIVTIICLIFLIIVRVKATSDKANNLPPQQFPIFVAAIAFVLWVYWLGGPFKHYEGVHKQFVASVLIVLWSFIIPVFYKGSVS